MPLIEFKTAINIVEDLNAMLVLQEHPIRVTDGTFYVSTDGYDVAISFNDQHVFDDNSTWSEEEDNLDVEQLVLYIIKKQLYTYMDAIEAAVNVVERKLSLLEKKQGQSNTQTKTKSACHR